MCGKITIFYVSLLPRMFRFLVNLYQTAISVQYILLVKHRTVS